MGAWLDLLPTDEPSGDFDPRSLTGVPDAARRWLTHSIAPGTPLYRAAVVEMEGEIRISRWLPFRAVQLHAPPVGYIWAARAKLGPLRISGFDRYASGQGQMVWKLLNRLSVVNAGGPDISRSAAGRLALDAFLVPTAFLSPAVTWLGRTDQSTATARWSVDGHELDVTMTVSPDGRLLSAVMDRWGNPNRRPWGVYPCGGLTAADATFEGITIPTSLRAGWFFGTAGWAEGEFFRARISQVTYL